MAEFMFPNVAYRSTVYRTGDPTMNIKCHGTAVRLLISLPFPYYQHTKGQIKLKAVWARCRFSQKRQRNEFVLFAVKSKKANKTNSFDCFLGESTACQSAFGFI